jgi:hypothetical protein
MVVSAGTFGPPAVRSMRSSTSVQDTDVTNNQQTARNIRGLFKNLLNIMSVPLAVRAHQPAAGWVRWLGVLITHFFNYMAFCLLLTTENCSEYETRRCACLRAKNGLKRHLLKPIDPSFFSLQYQT